MSPELGRARKAFPVTADSTYLATGSWGPISETYSVTLRRATLEELRQGRMNAERFERIETATETIRHELAYLLGADDSEIALTQSTSASLETVIREFPFAPGDEVVCTQLEHPACTMPLNEGASRGRFDVVLAQVPESGAEDLHWLEKCITERTRMIAVTAVSFETGQRLPIGQIGALASRLGIRTLLDGAQIVGAMPLDLARAGIDFCAFPLQKWLLGPDGIGGLYVRTGAAEGLARDRLTQSRGVLEATAAHLRWMRRSVGWASIFERTGALAMHTREAFARRGAVRLITPEAHAGLVTIEAPAGSRERIAKRLRRKRIVLRIWPELDRYRLSTAFFNTEREIDAAVRAIA